MNYKDVLDKLSPALSDASMMLLEPLVRYSHLSVSDEGICCDLEVNEDEEPETLILFNPRDPNAMTPEPLRRLFSVCGGMQIGEAGETGQLVLHDGYSGTIGTIGPDAWNKRFPIEYSTELCAPIDINLSSYYVFDPPNSRLYFIDEGLLEVVRDCADPVEIYLREAHYRLKVYEPVTNLQKAVHSVMDRYEWLDSYTE